MNQSVTVTIINWEKYNPKRDQKTYTWLKLNNKIHTDYKLFTLNAQQKYAFIALLCEASANNRQTFTFKLHWFAKLVQVRTKLLQDLFKKLKENNIIDFSYDTSVSYTETFTTPREEREENKKENKNKKEKDIPKPQAVRSQVTTPGSQVWESYRIAYEKRYKVEPVRNKTTNSQAKALAERLGVENACEVVRFYLSHNDSFFVRDQHPIGLCLSKAEALHTQWQRGTQVTGRMANQFEKTQTTNNAFDNVIAKLEKEKV